MGGFKKERGPFYPIRKGLHACGCFGSVANGTRDDEGPNGRYYRDDFNDYSWKCSVGTTDEDGIWLNRFDPAGTIMCIMVWILLGYSCLTIALLAQTGGISTYQSFIYTILVTMALSCHIKTTLTDPGSVPASAVPTEIQRNTSEKLSMCSQCQTFKPPLSHHCRICNRCVSKMDRKFIVRCLSTFIYSSFLLRIVTILIGIEKSVLSALLSIFFPTDSRYGFLF
jgi:hypothetical protein